MSQLLEDNVIQALQSGRKVQAIKLLRQERNIGLKEAKELVDQYLVEHPELQPKSPASFSQVVLMAAVVLLIFGVYRMLVGE